MNAKAGRESRYREKILRSIQAATRHSVAFHCDISWQKEKEGQRGCPINKHSDGVSPRVSRFLRRSCKRKCARRNLKYTANQTRANQRRPSSQSRFVNTVSSKYQCLDTHLIADLLIDLFFKYRCLNFHQWCLHTSNIRVYSMLKV